MLCFNLHLLCKRKRHKNTKSFSFAQSSGCRSVRYLCWLANYRFRKAIKRRINCLWSRRLHSRSLFPPCIIYWISNFTFVLFVIGFGSINKIARRRRKQSERANKKYLHWGGGFSFSDGWNKGPAIGASPARTEFLNKFPDTYSHLMQPNVCGNSPAASVRPFWSIFLQKKGAGCLPDGKYESGCRHGDETPSVS